MKSTVSVEVSEKYQLIPVFLNHVFSLTSNNVFQGIKAALNNGVFIQ